MTRSTFVRRQLLLAGAAAPLAALLAACGKTEQKPDASAGTAPKPAAAGPVAIRMGINPWPGSMPFMTADANGLFKAAGLDMKLTLFSSISQMMEAFNGGQIDATLIDPGTLLVSASNGVAQKFIFITDFSNGADAVVSIPAIKDLKGLKGQSISVEMGSIGHFLLLDGLARAGLGPKDVKLVNQTADLALAAFAAGRTKVAVSYEPFISQVTRNGKGRVIHSTREAQIAPDVVSMRQDFLAKHPDAGVRLIDAWYRTLEWRRGNLDAAIALEAKALDVSPADFRAFSDGVRLVEDPKEVQTLFSLEDTGQRTLAVITREVSAFMKAQKLLEKDPPPVAELVDASHIERYRAARTG